MPFRPRPAPAHAAATDIRAPSAQAITAANAREVESLRCVDEGVARQLSFSPDGRLLAIPAGSRLIIYDAHSLTEVHFIDPQVREKSPPLITALAFSPDGTMLAASTLKRIRVWRLDAKGGLSAQDLGYGGPESLAFSAMANSWPVAGTKGLAC